MLSIINIIYTNYALCQLGGLQSEGDLPAYFPELRARNPETEPAVFSLP